MGSTGTNSTSSDATRGMGDQFLDLKNDINPIIKELTGMTVQPGDFTDGVEFKTLTEKRRDEVLDFLNSVVTRIDDTGEKLHTTADDQDSTNESTSGCASSVPTG
jgi:hypothetical protein